jgi:MFS family permease
MTFLTTILFALLGGVLAHYGHSWRTPAFWMVMAIAALISILNFVDGIRVAGRSQ